nr:hypothetical protein [Burkholderia cepacia]
MAQEIPAKQFGAAKAGESVAPASELAAATKKIKELQRLLGKETLEVEILNEAVEWNRSKDLTAHLPSLAGDDR